MGVNGHAIRYFSVRELDFSVAARQVRVRFVATDVMYPVLSVAKLTEVEFGQQACLTGTNSRRDGVSVELRRRSGNHWIQMVRCAAKSSTVSLVTLSETVESPQGRPAIADVAKPVSK